MILFHSFNSYAATSFTKEKPLGVMSTAVKKKIAVSWEPVKGASGYEVYEAIEVTDLAENTDDKEQVGTDTQTESGKKTLTYKKIKETTGCRLQLRRSAPPCMSGPHPNRRRNLQIWALAHTDPQRKSKTTRRAIS